MSRSSQSSQESCSNCGAALSASERFCFTCQEDVGAPNVRRCTTDDNQKVLEERYNVSREQASENGCSQVFNDLEAAIKEKSGVVVCMPPSMGRNLLDDPKAIYTNYEILVGAAVRKPASFDDDRHRCAIGGILFGSYANSIAYGALSLNNSGIPTYGAVHCRLRSITIKKRTSFLETNSYRFVEEHDIKPKDKLPDGFMSNWEDRHKLVLAKISKALSPEQDESIWQSKLIQSDGLNRDNDNFVEAHIYKGFDRNSVKHIWGEEGIAKNKWERIDIRLINDRFKSFLRSPK